MASNLQLVRSPASVKERLIVALDLDDLERVKALVKLLAGELGMFKVGKQLFTHAGPAVVKMIEEMEGEVFLDLKFHDIPNTVAGAVRAVTPLGPAILNVHAAGGKAMMQAARDAAAETADKLRIRRPKLIAVTVLTSLDETDLEAVGQSAPIVDQVRRLAELTKESGLDGVVCSPREIEVLRRDLGDDFLLVAPGIRPS